tara:strand:+ start:8134 stop:8721 length:588 start_codon:yes stop_codon:yes gene_type:complete
MKVNVKDNIKEVTKWTTSVQKKQIPFATSNAINTTLFQLKKEMAKQTVKKLDNPTPFTQRGFFIEKAKKSKLFGALFARKEVADYLHYQIEGGVRASGKKFAIPTSNAKLNKFGNIPNKKGGVVKKKNQKIMTIKGMTGVYETHKDRTLKLIVAFKNSATYKIKFPFYVIAQKFSQAKFDKNFVEAFNKALRSAK